MKQQEENKGFKEFGISVQEAIKNLQIFNDSLPTVEEIMKAREKDGFMDKNSR